MRFDVTVGGNTQCAVDSRTLHRVLRDAGHTNKEAKAVIAWCIQNPRYQYDRRGVLAGMAA